MNRELLGKLLRHNGAERVSPALAELPAEIAGELVATVHGVEFVFTTDIDREGDNVVHVLRNGRQIAKKFYNYIYENEIEMLDYIHMPIVKLLKEKTNSTYLTMEKDDTALRLNLIRKNTVIMLIDNIYYSNSPYHKTYQKYNVSS